MLIAAPPHKKPRGISNEVSAIPDGLARTVSHRRVYSEIPTTTDAITQDRIPPRPLGLIAPAMNGRKKAYTAAIVMLCIPFQTRPPSSLTGLRSALDSK